MLGLCPTADALEIHPVRGPENPGHRRSPDIRAFPRLRGSSFKSPDLRENPSRSSLQGREGPLKAPSWYHLASRKQTAACSSFDTLRMAGYCSSLDGLRMAGCRPRLILAVTGLPGEGYTAGRPSLSQLRGDVRATRGREISSFLSLSVGRLIAYSSPSMPFHRILPHRCGLCYSLAASALQPGASASFTHIAIR